MARETLQTLYLNELRDLYSAEQQLVKALPKMAKNAESEDLSEAFTSHLEETKNQVARLEQIFESLSESAKGKKCGGMEGIVEEGGETINEYEGSVLDAALISAAQRVEHYEMAAYGAVCAYAQLLGRSEDLGLLKETLEEEKKADEKLTELSETVNQSALRGDEEEPRAVEPRSTSRSKKTRTAA
ncbi:MAG TPA: ferritin-like domain-containing protein [Terriglobales bacterium]|nr:ferritin-like domain-containing protein [Terriglobales bacterium]